MHLQQDISPWVVRYGTGSGACEVENQRLSVPNAPYALPAITSFFIPCSQFPSWEGLGVGYDSRFPIPWVQRYSYHIQQQWTTSTILSLDKGQSFSNYSTNYAIAGRVVINLTKMTTIFW
ncbi:MAG: hypothetical protein F6K56_10345 [Moorea sp. SIO3G5]|nr:hypothetical protein [Moorena sp. SIO3G5]